MCCIPLGERWIPAGAVGLSHHACPQQHEVAHLTAAAFLHARLPGHQPTTLQVVATINCGQHRGVSPNVAVTWTGRLVGSNTLLSPREQRALLALLAEMPTGDM